MDKRNKLEKVLDIESSSSVIEYDDDPKSLVVKTQPDDYDNKDMEIENQLDDIYEKAMDAFEDQMEATADLEGKYMARNTEVSNQLLGTALSAIKEKNSLKRHKDGIKLRTEQGSSDNITNNNHLVIDRNAIMDMLKDKD